MPSLNANESTSVVLSLPRYRRLRVRMARSPINSTLTSASGWPTLRNSFRSFFLSGAIAGLRLFRLLFILMFTAFFFSEKLLAGIVDSVVKNAGKDEVEAPRNDAEVRKREIAHAELVIKEDAGYDAVRQRLDPLRRRVFKGPRRSLDGVGQHHDCGDLRPRAGTRVAVILFRDLDVGLEILGLLVKIGYERGAVMLLDYVDDLRRQLVFTRDLHAVLHMRRNYEATHRRHETIMLVLGDALVLDEIFRFPDLAHIVIVRPDAGKERVLSDGLGRCLGKVPYDDAVVIRPGALVDELLEQRLVGIEEFEELDVCGDIEEGLKKRQRHRDDDGHDARTEEPGGHVVAAPDQKLSLVEVYSGNGDDIDESRERACP